MERAEKQFFARIGHIIRDNVLISLISVQAQADMLVGSAPTGPLLVKESAYPSSVTLASTFEVPIAVKVQIPTFSGLVFQLEAGRHSDQYAATLRPEKEHVGQ